jgi:hypothetical protein
MGVGEGGVGYRKRFTQRRGGRGAMLLPASCWSQRRAEHNLFVLCTPAAPASIVPRRPKF